MRRAGFPARHLGHDVDADESPWCNTFGRIVGRTGCGAVSLLIGPRGTGKTQLAVCVARVVELSTEAQRGPSATARTRYTTAVGLFIDVKETYGDDAQRSERAAVDAFCKPDLLVIDEVQERAGTDWEQRLLAAIVDRRYAAMKDTILVGNLKADDVQRELGTSIASRAQETGGIYVADWASFRARSAGGAA